MKKRFASVLAGAAAVLLSAGAAAETLIYSQDFNSVPLGQLTQWSFADVHSGVPTLEPGNLLPPLSPVPTPLRFLGEFGGNDLVRLTLPLPQDVMSVRLRFDAYLLRTWDGEDVQFSPPDVFGYGISGETPLVDASFSNGGGNQTYCPFGPVPCPPTWGSDGDLKDKLGAVVMVDPVEGATVPPRGLPLSLVYHFDSGPITYSGSSVSFDFFSRDLQLRPDLALLNGRAWNVIDESWGLDNVAVTVQAIPEPATVALLPAGMVVLMAAVRRRRQAIR